ncbi:MAG TPA: TatD family hydrolase [Candidatus Saccharimonadia bacterium]|nr:TatD family hydrolase [Candidatus Saccharimonadia bacterium]
MDELVDTHCHIQSIGAGEGERTTREIWAKNEALTADGVVEAARQDGVSRLLCIGCDLVDSRLAIKFVQGREGCWASIGLHPHEAQHFAGQKAELEEFASLVGQPKVVAVGECGLDYYYEHSPKEAQLEVLKFQLELAQKHDLPLVFHVREAFDDFWPIFDGYQGLRGVLHSFTDSANNLAKALERGLYLGVNGIATFAKDPKQLDVYKNIPLEHLLLETDAPFLTPTPYRGSINEPRRVGTIADFLAELRGETRADLAKTTTANARRLFGI